MATTDDTPTGPDTPRVPGDQFFDDGPEPESPHKEPVNRRHLSILERISMVEEETAELTRQMTLAVLKRDRQHTETNTSLASLKLDDSVILQKLTALEAKVDVVQVDNRQILHRLGSLTDNVSELLQRIIAAGVREEQRDARLVLEFARLSRTGSLHDIVIDELSRKLTLGEQMQNAVKLGVYQGGKLLLPVLVSTVVIAVLSHLHLLGGH